MDNIKRSPKETAKIIALTIDEIQESFNGKNFKARKMDGLIRVVCQKNNINEKHIRQVAGWGK